jgi:predicted O-linked N-acetylglucosamine transferase (SPINDLY family)
LPQCDPAAIRNLQREAESRGVAAPRLVIAPFVSSVEDHLARLGLADLFLDTLSYNAHTSACDALWAGVPVVTSPGNSFATRVAASVLSAIGLPELIVESLEVYEAKAAALAQNPGALSALKAKLMRHREMYPLFHTDAFTRHLEAAYVSMWQRHQRGEGPQTFAVACADGAGRL